MHWGFRVAAMTTPLEAAVAELLRKWNDPSFKGWSWLEDEVEALRAAHANHVDGGEYQRGRRDGAAAERAAVARMICGVRDAAEAELGKPGTGVDREWLTGRAGVCYRLLFDLKCRADAPSREEPR